MKKQLINGFLLAQAIILPIVLSGCSGGGENQTVREQRAVSVRGMITELAATELTKSFTGTLEGKQQALITAKISEAVENIFVKEGDNVKANDILISLDKTGPTSNYAQTSSLYKNAEKNYNKIKYLFEEGAVSESQFDGARTEYEIAKANFEASGRVVDIRTPIEGMVTAVNVSVGEYLYPGMKLATVASIRKLRMNLGVSDADILYFGVGDKVTVTVESINDAVAYGQVITAARSADPETRTFQVEIEIDNPTLALKPGMFARGEIVLEKFDNIIIIPRGAVVTRDNVSYVFAKNGDKASLRPVTVGIEFNGSIEIKTGLIPGDTVITVGQDYLDDGYLINLVKLVNNRGEEIAL